jgi:phage replication-related protein YjqB (UPF0714/DUF867 family)
VTRLSLLSTVLSQCPQNSSMADVLPKPHTRYRDAHRPERKLYRSHADLAAAQAEGEDFRVVVVPRATSQVATMAPHGGSIEAHTSSIARQIAGTDFNLCLLERTRPAVDG